MIFKSAKLTLVAEDGTEYSPEISEAQLKAIVTACGYRLGKDIDGIGPMFYSWSDKTIESRVLPLLPKIKVA